MSGVIKMFASSQLIPIGLIAVAVVVSGCQTTSNEFRNIEAEVQAVAPARTTTVTGLVRNPGEFEFPVHGGLTIQKAIALAGGLIPANYVFRPLDSDGSTLADSYLEQIRELAVTLQRGNVTYVVPAELIDASEVGRIRLSDRDVLAVVSANSLGFRTAAEGIETDAIDREANPLKNVVINGLVTAAGGVRSISEIEQQINQDPDTAKEKADSALFVIGQNDLVDNDRTLPPAFARVSRRVTTTGLPQVIYIPLTVGQRDSPGEIFREMYHLRGGDMLTYLPLGTDPLVTMSEQTEERIARELDRLRRLAEVSVRRR